MTHRKSTAHDTIVGQIATPVKQILRQFSIVLFLLFAVGIIILAKVNSPATVAVRVAIVDTFSPLLVIWSRPVHFVASTRDKIQNFFHVYEDNKKLTQENAALQLQSEKAKALEAENVSLKKLLHFVEEPRMTYMSARIIADTSGPYLRTAVINVGSDQHVRKGYSVINDRGLVGRVIELGKHSSRILLITDINSKIPVMTNESRERGIVGGDNTDLLQLHYLPDDTKVRIGELVVTSGDGDIFPAGIPIGTIYTVSDKVIVKPVVEWHRLEFVSIINAYQ